jgi:hypothetical protein
MLWVSVFFGEVTDQTLNQSDTRDHNADETQNQSDRRDHKYGPINQRLSSYE